MITLGTAELPDDLAWIDRYGWQSMQVSVEYSLTGAAIIQMSEKLAGRPITLQGADDRAWATREMADTLKAMQATGDEYALSVRGESYTVIIESVDAAPLWDCADDSDPVALTVKLITL